jgi:hypothetical protein
MGRLKKTLYTLNLNPEKYQDITTLTYPWLKHYAKKIGADFFEITERKFPGWPPTFEKLQVYELGRKHGNDWNIFFDADTMIHPDALDFTIQLPKDTVAHHGSDMANFRFVYDRFYMRDGRNIGSATWACVCSDWCIEMMEPPTDITPDEVNRAIFPTAAELRGGMAPIRLIEDFLIGRNIAKYGLKFITFKEIMKRLGLEAIGHFFHIYNVPRAQKIEHMKQLLALNPPHGWGLGLPKGVSLMPHTIPQDAVIVDKAIMDEGPTPTIPGGRK